MYEEVEGYEVYVITYNTPDNLYNICKDIQLNLRDFIP